MALIDFWWDSAKIALIIASSMISFFGLKLLLSSLSSPEKRAEIKDYLEGLINFFVVLFLSGPVYAILVKISGAITRIGFTDSNFFNNAGGALGSETLIDAYSLGSQFAMLTVSMQRILLVLGIMLLPFAVLLLFMSFSASLKNLGYSILTFFFIVIFLPPVNSLIFKAADFAAANIAQSPAYVLVAAFWLVGLVNLMAFHTALSVARSDYTRVMVNNVITRARGVGP